MIMLKICRLIKIDLILRVDGEVENREPLTAPGWMT